MFFKIGIFALDYYFEKAMAVFALKSFIFIFYDPATNNLL